MKGVALERVLLFFMYQNVIKLFTNVYYCSIITSKGVEDMNSKYDLYTVKEVADKLKMKPRTILQYIRDGKLKAINFGRDYRVTGKVLKEYIDLKQKESE